MRSSRRRAREDEGYALLIALVFIGSIALVISALLAQSFSQFKAERAFRERREGIYAADAGLEHAVAGIGMRPGTVELGECSTTDTIVYRNKGVAKSSGASVGLTSFSLPQGSGTNRMLIVAVSHEGNRAVSTVQVETKAPVTAAQGQFRRVAGVSGGTNGTTEVWYLLDSQLPDAAGAYDVTVAVDGADEFAVHASIWTGVSQGAPGWVTRSVNSGDDYIEASFGTSPADGSLVYSAAGTADGSDGARGGGTGAGQPLSGFTSSEGPASAAFATSYRIQTPGAGASVRQAFDDDWFGEPSMRPGTQVLLAASPAMNNSECPGVPSLVDSEDAVETRGFLEFGDWFNVRHDSFRVTAPGHNRLLIVAVNDDDWPADLVTFGGQNMNLASRADTSGNHTSVWYLQDDSLPAPADYEIVVHSPTALPTYTLHMSTFTGVLKTYGTSDDAHNPPPGVSGSTITSMVNTDANSLVFSAAGRDGSGGMNDAGLIGTDRIPAGAAQSGTSFGTSWKAVPAATVDYSVTEAFNSASGGASHVVAVFRPASWAPVQFGATCEEGLGPFQYNEYTVVANCVPNAARDTLTLTSTAVAPDGREITAHATVTRLKDSGTIKIVEWDTRPSGAP